MTTRPVRSGVVPTIRASPSTSVVGGSRSATSTTATSSAVRVTSTSVRSGAVPTVSKPSSSSTSRTSHAAPPAGLPSLPPAAAASPRTTSTLRTTTSSSAAASPLSPRVIAPITGTVQKSTTAAVVSTPLARSATPVSAATPSTTSSSSSSVRTVIPTSSPIVPALSAPSSSLTSTPVSSSTSSSSSSVAPASTRRAPAPRPADSSDDDDGPDNDEGTRLNFRSIVLLEKAEKIAAARASAQQRPSSSSNDVDEDEQMTNRANNGSTVAASAIDMSRSSPTDDIDSSSLPPSLPALLDDDDNDLFYSARVTTLTLQRITGQSDLSLVTSLSLVLDTEAQDLRELSLLLPSLTALHLIPPLSFVSSFRDFGRSSLARIKILDLPRAGLRDLDGIESLNQLAEFRASGNRISDLQPLMFALQLTYLDLSENLVSEVDMLEFIACLSLLTGVALEGNPISMKSAYRSIVASRCTDILDFTLDGLQVTEADRQRRSDADENVTDRAKVKAWAERHAQAAIDAEKHSRKRTTIGSGGGGAGSFAMVLERAPSLSNLPSFNPSLSTSSSYSSSAPISAASLAKKKQQYQLFLDSKEVVASPASVKSAQSRNEKNKAVAEILRFESEDATSAGGRGEAAAAAFAAAARSRGAIEGMHNAKKPGGSMNAALAAAATMAATTAVGLMQSPSPPSSSSHAVPAIVPRLSFDSAPLAASPMSASSSSSSRNAGSDSFHFGANHGASVQLSLSTPRPSSSSGVRPGPAAGGRRPRSRGEEESAFFSNPDTQTTNTASDLTYGSDGAIMAGNFAQAMRARKRGDSAARERSTATPMAVVDTDGSESPSLSSSSYNNYRQPESPRSQQYNQSLPPSSSSSITPVISAPIVRNNSAGASTPVVLVIGANGRANRSGSVPSATPGSTSANVRTPTPPSMVASSPSSSSSSLRPQIKNATPSALSISTSSANASASMMARHQAAANGSSMPISSPISGSRISSTRR